MIERVVFDTSTVISALLFTNGSLAWLRAHWRSGDCLPLASRHTAAELTRVLAYPKFRLSADDRLELLADYLPYCETLNDRARSEYQCRDVRDQMFLDLAQAARCHTLVSGDRDLLVLAGSTEFLIETPEGYRQRIRRIE